MCCKEGAADRLFCLNCWELLAAPDPAERCRHCFELTDLELCSKCNTKPDLCFPRLKLFDPVPPAWILKAKMEEMKEALASLCLLFWHRLELDLPDLIIPIPDEKRRQRSPQVASIFASLLNRPCLKALQKNHMHFLKPQIFLSKNSLQENQTILLFDGGNSTAWLQSACNKTAELFPKQATVLSLL